MAKRRRGGARAQDQAHRLAQSVKVGRAIHSMTRQVASDRAGISRATWDRIERGATTVTLANLVAATDAVGLDLVCQTYQGRGPSLRDSGQLGIAQMILAMTHSSWRANLEERAGEHGEAADMALHQTTEVMMIEIERWMVDFQAQYRRASLKRDWLEAHLGIPVRLVMMIEDTRRNRTVMAPHLSLVGSILPMGSRPVMNAIRTGKPLGANGLCWVRAPHRHSPPLTDDAEVHRS